MRKEIVDFKVLELNEFIRMSQTDQQSLVIVWRHEPLETSYACFTKLPTHL
jgi:hypothetical protein